MWSLKYEAMKQLINFGHFTFQPLQETSHLVIYTRSSHNKARAFVIFFLLKPLMAILLIMIKCKSITL